MRSISQVRVREAIFHILDHHTSTKLVLSDTVISTHNRQELADYICQHIVSSLGDETAKAARFENHDYEIAKIAQKLINDSTDLLNSSQEIARRLYEIIKDDTRISPGVLVVCLFEDIEANNQTYLGIIKLDPASVYRSQTTTDSAGKITVDFASIPDALPTVRERLQKCAFLRSPSTEQSYDLIVLDRQTSGAEEISQFFAEKFLGIVPAFDSRTCTLGLYKALTEAQKILRSHLDSEQNLILSQAKDYAMKSEIIDVDEFVAALAIPEPAKKTVLDTVKQFIPDRKFEIDSEIGRKISRKKRFKGEQGFKLEVNSSDYDRVVESIEPEANSTYSKIVLRVKNLEER